MPLTVPVESLHAWFIKDGYLWDWLVSFVLIVINETVPDAIGQVPRIAIPNDPALSYPLKSNTIPSLYLYGLCFIMPAAIMVAVTAARRSAADGHHGLLTLVEGFALATFFKRWMTIVGRYRPNWYASVAAGVSLDDARQAYPSGHATYIFNSGVILSCFLIAKLKLLNTGSQAHFLKVVLCMLPLWLAAFVAMTRVADYKHDFSDVNAGIFIGIATGLVAYFINYPSLLASNCSEPKLRSRDSPLGPASFQAGSQHQGYVPLPQEGDKPASDIGGSATTV